MYITARPGKVTRNRRLGNNFTSRTSRKNYQNSHSLVSTTFETSIIAEVLMKKGLFLCPLLRPFKEHLLVFRAQFWRTIPIPMKLGRNWSMWVLNLPLFYMKLEDHYQKAFFYRKYTFSWKLSKLGTNFFSQIKFIKLFLFLCESRRS